MIRRAATERARRLHRPSPMREHGLIWREFSQQRRRRAVATLVGALASVVGCSRGSGPGESALASASASASAIAPPRPTAPSNGLPMPSASVAAVVNPGALPVYDGPTGSVEGTVLVRGPEAPPTPGVNFRACPAAIDVYGKLFRAGLARADGLRPLADAVVVVTGYAGYYLPETSDAQLVKISASCAYPLRTIALTFGQRLEVANESKLSFAPYLEGTPEVAVMIAPPEEHGEPVKIYPPQAGYFGLRDRLQTFAREDVYILRHPLHAVSDVAGHFRIDGVPTGKLKVGARLAAVGSEQQVDLEVRANVVENVELVLTYAPNAQVDAGKPPPKGAPHGRTDPGGRLPPND
jgi:hypothetical protein